MMKAQKMFWVVYLPALLAAVAWFLNGPVPRGFSRRWALRREMAGHKVWLTAVRIADIFGLTYAEYSLESFEPQGEKSESSSNVSVTPEEFDGVPVHVYRPKGQQGKNPLGFPALVYYDGAHLTFTPKSEYHKTLLEVTSELNIVVVSVQYAVGLESGIRFPKALDDCLAATKYVLHNAKSLDIDPSRVAVGGDSAGGNLAAAVSLRLRDEDFSPQPTAQVLIYPALQAMDFSLPSHVQNRHGPFLDAYSITRFWSIYASGSTKHTSYFSSNDHTTPEGKKHTYSNHIRHEDLVMDYHYKPYSKPKLENGNPQIWNELKHVLENPGFTPLLAGDFSRLPSTFVYTAHYDVLRDEGLLFVQKLKANGTRVTHVHGTKAYHGIFVGHRHFPEGEDCYRDVLGFLRKAL